uniref:EF-hand domain-containing protein n=1 Tax=Phaeomonas parva TaxID=124430 RepID=A0A7S1U7S6_9STRA|mmetsp:Transcript_34103/g.107503  ORF Transcript_34103/g.107503 Transcript_34103/m.107503 type:complete len:545 (+) Transcript_34103:254-1888(+)
MLGAKISPTPPAPAAEGKDEGEGMASVSRTPTTPTGGGRAAIVRGLSQDLSIIGEKALKENEQKKTAKEMMKRLALTLDLNTICLLIFVGGVIYQHVEDGIEREQLEEQQEDILHVAEDLNMTDAQTSTLLEFSGVDEDLDDFEPMFDPETWDKASSYFFAFSIATTVGYGSFVPTTDESKIFSIFFALITIPLIGYLLQVTGERVLNVMHQMYLISKGVAYDDHVQNALASWDNDGSGSVDAKEIQHGLFILGYNSSYHEIEKIIRSHHVQKLTASIGERLAKMPATRPRSPEGAADDEPSTAASPASEPKSPLLKLSNIGSKVKTTQAFGRAAKSSYVRQEGNHIPTSREGVEPFKAICSAMDVNILAIGCQVWSVAPSPVTDALASAATLMASPWPAPEQVERFVLAFTIFLLLLFVGAVCFMALENWNYLDSVYFCVMTVTTVGLGDYAPATSAGMAVQIVYCMAGLGITSSVIQSAFKLAQLGYKSVKEEIAEFQESLGEIAAETEAHTAAASKLRTLTKHTSRAYKSLTSSATSELSD